jgi:hypothetical protein
MVGKKVSLVEVVSLRHVVCWVGARVGASRSILRLLCSFSESALLAWAYVLWSYSRDEATAYLAGWTKRLRRAEDVIGEVGGVAWIAPGGTAPRAEWYVGLRGGSRPWAVWHATSEGAGSWHRRVETKPGRDRCGFEAARRLRADIGCGCRAEGS